MIASTAYPVLDTSLDLLRAAVTDAVGQLGNTSPCADWNVGQVLEHATLDQLIWAASVTGSPGPDGDAFAPTGHHFDDIGDAVEAMISAARTAWSTVAGMVGTPLPQGPMTVASAAAACGLDAAVHAWDVARATGSPSPLTDDLAGALLPVARSIAEPLRQWGAFAPSLPAQPEDGVADTLLRYLGRNPRWTP